MFMQAGFAMVETGFTRAKNAVHTMAMNFVIYPIGMLGFWLIGFGAHDGRRRPAGRRSAAPRAGAHEFGDAHRRPPSAACSARRSFALLERRRTIPASLAMFLFQMVFMDTAATIPTGAMAERWKFSSFVVYGLFMSMLLYPLYGNWVWGGGWLAALGSELRARPRPRRLRRLVGRAHDRRRDGAGRARSCSGRASASSGATGRSAPSPATTCRWRCSAR